jgi:hypothetical protein
MTIVHIWCGDAGIRVGRWFGVGPRGGDGQPVYWVGVEGWIRCSGSDYPDTPTSAENSATDVRATR